MRERGNAGPGWGSRAGSNAPAVRTTNATCKFTPVALEIFKRDRWVVVAKVVMLDRRPVLAIAIRNQRGTRTAVSVPEAVIDFAINQGAREFVWRDDRAMEVRRMPLGDLKTRGWLQADGERYVLLDDMQVTPWQRWAFATIVVRLGSDGALVAPGETTAPLQPPLFGGA